MHAALDGMAKGCPDSQKEGLKSLPWGMGAYKRGIAQICHFALKQAFTAFYIDPL